MLPTIYSNIIICCISPKKDEIREVDSGAPYKMSIDGGQFMNRVWIVIKMETGEI